MADSSNDDLMLIGDVVGARNHSCDGKRQLVLKNQDRRIGVCDYRCFGDCKDQPLPASFSSSDFVV
ncbi:hypothetical protein L484_008722 [Morus notabilis]|uniref:Uncharacterized protein n=1 Tax=Morus notabilis TaxID=981085 RepID=W9RLI6_9ROSA|nr:hypothetical protein L484_008722 [Morus notabilis]